MTQILWLISMGCDVGCPFIGRAFDDDWGLMDPTGKSDDEFKKVVVIDDLKYEKIGGYYENI